jgi:acyl carrier protein
MMTKQDILARIQHVLTETFELEAASVVPEANLFSDLGLDSFDAVDLAVTLEVDTGIRLNESEMRPIRTVSDVVETIHRKISMNDAHTG